MLDVHLMPRRQEKIEFQDMDEFIPWSLLICVITNLIQY